MSNDRVSFLHSCIKSVYCSFFYFCFLFLLLVALLCYRSFSVLCQSNHRFAISVSFCGKMALSVCASVSQEYVEFFELELVSIFSFFCHFNLIHFFSCAKKRALVHKAVNFEFHSPKQKQWETMRAINLAMSFASQSPIQLNFFPPKANNAIAFVILITLNVFILFLFRLLLIILRWRRLN